MSLDSATTPPIPDDNPERTATIVNADRDDIPHISLAGDTYTVLLSGGDTAGRYTLIDKHVPPGGGPPPHRHDFEEMFTVLDGEIEVTFRGETTTASAGTTVNVPANAPHGFGNHSHEVARLLCVCSPSGQEEFFMEVGDPVVDRTAPPPQLSDTAIAERKAKGRGPGAQIRHRVCTTCMTKTHTHGRRRQNPLPPTFCESSRGEWNERRREQPSSIQPDYGR